jgi:hypothetical protein
MARKKYLCCKTCGRSFSKHATSKKQRAASMCTKHWKAHCAKVQETRLRLLQKGRLARIVNASPCKRKGCDGQVRRKQVGQRQREANLCNKHWAEHVAAGKKRWSRHCTKLAKSKIVQQARVRIQWDILQPQGGAVHSKKGVVAKGAWAQPKLILLLKATHHYNEGVHVAQTRGGKTASITGPATVMNCMRRARCILKKLDGEDKISDGSGIYLLIYGAKETRDPGAGRKPALHNKGNWGKRAAGKALVALRCSKLLAPALAAAKWPRRPDTGRYVKPAAGPKQAMPKACRARWGDVGRTTRLGPAVIVSQAYRIFPLGAKSPESLALDNTWRTIAELDRGSLPVCLRPSSPEWGNAARALADAWDCARV